MKQPTLFILSSLLILGSWPNSAHSEEKAKTVVSEAKELEKISQCEKLPLITQKELWEVANCYFKVKNYDKAIKTLRDLYAKHPKDLDAFFIASFNIWKKAANKTGEERDVLEKEALEELNRASVLNPLHWRVYLELGDFYYLKLKKPERAYKYYLTARQYYGGDPAQNIPSAEPGQKSSIENRIARTNEELDRAGEAVSASCLSLHWDPDSKEALDRLARLAGSCKRKDFRGHIINKGKKSNKSND